MNSGITDRRGWRGNKRTIIALTSCVFAIGLMALGLSAGSGSRATTAKPQDQANADNLHKKKLPTWNMALGNIVVVARELGFSIQGEKGAVLEEGKLASRIEGKLQPLRELYRRESENNPALMGAMTLQLRVNQTGEVTDVKELASRITDNEFKKAVLAAISDWHFSDLVPEAAIIHCPLLFVREGMDITTLVNWEKSLGQSGTKTTLAKNSPPPNQANKSSDSLKGADRTSKAVNTATGKPSATKMAAEEYADTLYQIKYGTAIRKEPSFSSPAVAKVTTGMNVTVLARSGDWLKVRYAEGGPSGYLRKEFLAPITMVKN